MGIFSKDKKRNNNKSPNIEDIGFYTIPYGNNQSITIFNINKRTDVKYENVFTTKLMTARIIQHGNDDCVIFSSADHLSFEINEGESISDDILQKISLDYLSEKQKNNEEISIYLGRYEKNQNRWENCGKNYSVEDYVRRKIDPEIMQERKLREEKLKEQYNRRVQRENFRSNISDNGNYLREEKSLRETRIKNPNLKLVDSFEIDGRKYYNYDGTNMYNGEILRIRKLDKVGKDGEENYLYSGYINSTLNEYDVEIIGNKSRPMGQAVCFTTKGRLEDIVKGQDINEICQVLTLLSNPNNFINRGDKLIYVGEIDKNGVARESTEPSSSATKYAVERLKKEYEKQTEGIQRS